MDPSKLKNKRWTALVPQRQSLHRTRISTSTSSKPIHLIGKLPEEAYIQIYTYIGLSDIVNLALSCRQLAALSHNERVWRNKLKILDWKGGDPPEAAKILARLKGQVDDAGLASAERAARRISLQDHHSHHPPTSSKRPTVPTTITDTTSTSSSSKVNGSTSKRDSSLSTSNLSQPTNHPIVPQSSSSASTKAPSLTDTVDDTSLGNDDDDGFGDFVDFSSDLTSTSAQNGNSTSSTNLFASPNHNGINGSFTQIDLNAQPLQPTKAHPNGSTKTTNKQEEDLLMLFDDGVEDIGLNHATPAAAPSKPAANTGSLNGSTRRNSIQSNTNTSIATNTSSSSTISSSNTHHSSSLSRDLFIAYFKYSMPYYISLQYQSTSSLIFTQSQPAPLTDIEKAYILSNLTRLLGNKSISPTQYEETRLKTTRRNLQSSIDYFNAFLLGKFEKSSDQRIISKMREAAWASYALNDTSSNSSNGSNGGNGASSSSSAASSVIQVFINKIPLFYDSSWDPLANLTKTFDMTGQLVDGIDFSAMDSFMNHVIGTVQKEGTTIARVFPPDSDALVYFTDRIANDVISDYIVPLLNAAHNLTNPLFLLTTAATFGQLQRLVETVCSIEPKSSAVTMTSVSKVVYDMFRPYTSDYLKEEPNWCREYLNEICVQWERKLAEERANRDPTFLNAQNPQQAKKNILAGFTKALLLPVTIVPKTVALSVNAITQGSTMAFNAMTGTFTSSSSATLANGGTSTPKGSMPATAIGTASVRTSGTSTPPITPSSLEKKEFPSLHGESFQSLISIETAMQLIQADRECLKRVQTFAGYTGDVGLRVKRVIEDIFVILCQTVSANHLTPAFAKATEQMGQYKPSDHAVDESVAPLVQFFELVHIGDTILQMVQVYYDREMVKYIDKNDFLSQVVREKKKFENALDESVASGLNAGVNILMTQAEYILQTQQETSDFCPELKNGTNSSNAKNVVVDIEGPTKAAEAVVDCLKSHCQMLKGSTDKAILEVFHQEVGLRLHGMLLKHLKKSIVSISGGFQVIADLNLYTSFINSLKLPNVNPYFTALKMAANVFIIDSPRDLGMMARDLERYEGTLRIEDIMEMVQCRTDWKKIEREVEKEVFGFKTEDCIIT